jgi:hypothetical protein
VVAKVRKRLSVSKQAVQKFHMEKFNIRKLNDMEVRKECQVEISNRFTAVEYFDDDHDVGINRALKRITGSMKASAKESLGYCELKQHKYGLMKTAQNY